MPVWGLISGVDGAAIERAIARVRERFPNGPFRLLEVGLCWGQSSRAIAEVCASQGIPLEFWGIDNGRDGQAGAPCASEPPFPGANVIVGDSAEVYFRVPAPLHLAFIDGCHAANYVMLDALNYGDRLAVGGEIIFHDAAPRSQGKKDWQGVGPKDHPDFGTATLEALRKLGLWPEVRRTDWRLVEHAFDPTLDSAGVAIYERLSA
jgi:hypothetical protein